MAYISLTDTLLSLTTLAGVALCILFRASLNQLLLVYLGAILLDFAAHFIITALRFVLPDLRFDASFAALMIKKSFPFVLVGVFLTVMTRIDTVMIKTMKGDCETGYYGIGRNLISALMFIPANFNAVFYPLFSRLYKTDHVLLNKYSEKSFLFMALLALPIGVGGTLMAENIITLFYGAQYLPAVFSFQILIWALAVQFLYSNVNILLMAAEKQSIVAWVTFLCMAFNIVFNTLAIPRFSFAGASMATLATNIVLLISFFCITVKHLHRRATPVPFLKLLPCTGIMGLVVYYLKSCNLFLVIGCAVICYALLVYLFRIVDKQDLALFQNLYKKRAGK
jgi:O-antigen/teichoic acid export membrane protein